MKKLMASLLALTLTMSVVACGGGSSATEESGSVDSGANNAAVSQETEEAEEESDAQEAGSDAQETGSDAQEADAESGESDSGPETVEFQEIVVVDNDQCVIKLTGINPDDMWGYSIKAELENKSADKTYMYSVATASINGVECDPVFATEVASGKKSNSDINFSTDELEENGIGDFTDIEMTFRVSDSDDWLADPVALETVHVYPYGEENATVFVREPQASDTVLADNDSCTIIVTGYEEDDIWGYTANLYLVNKTDQSVIFSVDDAAVNGYMVDPFFAHSVAPGKCAFTSMSWSDSKLEENGITDVEEITFTLRAHNSDDYSTPDYVNENITLNP